MMAVLSPVPWVTRLILGGAGHPGTPLGVEPC